MKVYTVEKCPDKFLRGFPREENCRGVVRELIDKGVSDYSYLFVLESDGKIIGRIGYLSYEQSSLIPIRLELPWDSGGALTAGKLLAASSLKMMAQRTGATRFEDQIEQNLFATIGQLWDSMDMPVIEQRRNYRRELTELPDAVSAAEDFRSFSAIGQSGFTEIYAAAATGTLNNSGASEIVRDGAQVFAARAVEELKNMDFRPDIWSVLQVDGKPAGIVVPQLLTPAAGAVNYIAVLPEFRGRGISARLLQYAAAALQRLGAKKIIGATSTENIPMHRAFLRNGYETSGFIKWYRAEIDVIARNCEGFLSCAQVTAPRNANKCVAQ